MLPVHRMKVVVAAVSFALFLSTLALAQRADGFLYWSSYDTGAVGRANLDGTNVNANFISGGDDPLAVAVDTRHVFWGNQFGTQDSCRIGRANLNGTGTDQSFITGSARDPLCYPEDIAVDSGHVYWTNFDPLGIGRAKLNGGGVNQGFVTGVGNGEVVGVAVDNNHVYWSSKGAIGRAKLNGGGVKKRYIEGTTGVSGFALDAKHVYWWNTNTGAIGRVNRDGTGVNPSFIAPSNYACCTGGDVEVDTDHVYWTNYETNSIGRANLNGTDVNQNFITGVSTPTGIAVDVFPAKVDAMKTQSQQGKKIRVAVKVAAEVDRLTAKASGKIKVNSGYELKPKTIEIAAGQAMTMKLKPKRKKEAKKIAKALKQGKKVTAKLTIKLTDLTGQHSTEKLSVKLKD